MLTDDVWEIAKHITQETSLILRGKLIDNPRAPGGIELHVHDISITHLAKTPYPLGKKAQPPDVLMRWRHLAVRSPRYTKIWLVRERLLQLAREYFVKNGWHEVSPPIIVSTAVEGARPSLR